MKSTRSPSCIRAVLALSWMAMSVLVPATGHAQVYKWTDDKGRVHYGDEVPDDKKGKAKPIDTSKGDITPAQRREGEARAEKNKAAAKAEPARPVVAGSLGATRKPEAPASAPEQDPKEKCRDAWRQYNESAACFDSYRVIGGGLKAEAYQRCTEVTRPVAACE
jgi:hypothetical protein